MIKTIKYKDYKFDITVKTHPDFDGCIIDIYSIGAYVYHRNVRSSEKELENAILNIEQKAKDNIDNLLNENKAVTSLLLRMGFEEF